MSKIRTSLHGKQIGLNHDDQLQVPKGLVLGDHGKQVIFPSPSTIAFFDDFVGDVIADQWNLIEGTDAATSDGAVLAGGIGGVLRLTTGDAGTGLAADQEQLTQALQWQASNGGLVIQGRFKLSRITNAWCFFGFTDLATSLEGPIVSAASANTITTNATDAVGFMFDSRMTTQDWCLVGVKNDVDATLQDSLIAPVADRYQTFRIEVDSTGIAVFFINGAQVGTAMAAAITAATDLTPIFSVSNTSGTVTFTSELDYVHVAMSRGLDGTATNN